jgi:hypothetical protein
MYTLFRTAPCASMAQLRRHLRPRRHRRAGVLLDGQGGKTEVDQSTDQTSTVVKFPFYAMSMKQILDGWRSNFARQSRELLVGTELRIAVKRRKNYISTWCLGTAAFAHTVVDTIGPCPRVSLSGDESEGCAGVQRDGAPTKGSPNRAEARSWPSTTKAWARTKSSNERASPPGPSPACRRVIFIQCYQGPSKAVLTGRAVHDKL